MQELIIATQFIVFKEAVNFYLDHILIAISANFAARSAIESSFHTLILGVSKFVNLVLIVFLHHYCHIPFPPKKITDKTVQDKLWVNKQSLQIRWFD